ncbi:leucine-rich repeat receptor-like tyrosine-protein kinase pxc3 [Quercus suber]|uniref:Leucine-rich repeat receptor-like tyrosine-protein kinase pxc3 n=1 Tax=Quercus suber TaxID=58331 RepID=A0AAW0JVS5_QUESU
MAILRFFSLLLVGFVSELVGAELGDQTTLLAINKELVVPGWGVNSSDYCSWTRIYCSWNNSTVERLDLSRLQLRGNVTLISELKALKWLDLSYNDFDGSIPSAFGNLSDLEFLDLSSNKFEGSIPIELASLTNLKTLNLSSNFLVGEIPDELHRLEKLQAFQISSNKLSGSIPFWVGNLTHLRVFTAYENALVGKIPDNLGSVSELELLNLHSNHLEGSIPKSIFASGKLLVLILTLNGLSGDLPDEIGNCKGLSSIRIGNNDLYLILGQNSIQGEIPHEIGNCVKLLELEMGSNYLTGTIPPEIGHIKNLQIALNLSFNHLHGPLPIELGKLDKLVSLDVSNNRLSGNIPSALKGMLSLIEVNFSNNLLTGPIPNFVPFQKSPNSSFLRNKGLCGEPLSSACGTSSDSGHENYHHKVSYKIILAVIGSGLAVFLSVTVVVLLFMIRERQEKAAKAAGIEDDGTNNRPAIIAGNVFVENLRQAVDLDAVVKATLKDANKLISGTFSTVYKAVMPSGLILSVKRLKSMDRTIIHHQNKMIRELERLSKLCHDNLMRPIGFVIYEDVALLLHHYLPNGTLAQLLHESSKQPEYQPDWPTRLSIAVGVAEGLAFLHHVAIIHLDISSGNVLLDADFKPLVGEIEISKLLDPCRGTASISAVAGSFGYIPPEYAYTMQVTAPGNVYSYGVVLLEILTTRLPVDEAFGEGVDLVKWVHSAPARGETPEQILDAKLSTVSFGWRKEMLAALKVALLCTDSTPAKRPKMKKVVEMLQEIRQK